MDKLNLFDEALIKNDFRQLYKELGFHGCVMLLAQAAQQIEMFVQVIKEEYEAETKNQ